jgi:glycerol 3-phosphatase-1
MGSIAKPTGGAFTGSTLEVSFTGFLFDMDGTIIDSTPAVEKHWES